VRTTFQEVQRLLTTDGVIARRDYPELDTTLRYLVRRGDLVRILPGIYGAADQAASLQTRVRAISRLDPDAVLVGAVAARLSFWPDLRVDVIECAVRHSRAPQAGYCFSRRHIPDELVVTRSGLRYTTPALTALDLCATVGGDAIDQALRTRATTLAQLDRAMELTAARVGNRTRRQLLLDSRAEPWSQAERLFHCLYDTGWCVLRFTRPVSVGARVRRVQEHLVKQTGIVATAPGRASPDVTNEPDHSERARAGQKTRHDRRGA
jgi:hypothetical protein